MKKHWPEVASLIVLVIIGMNIKKDLERWENTDHIQAIVDSLVKHPEGNTYLLDTGGLLSSKYALIHEITVIDTTSWITEHSQLKPIK